MNSPAGMRTKLDDATACGDAAASGFSEAAAADARLARRQWVAASDTAARATMPSKRERIFMTRAAGWGWRFFPNTAMLAGWRTRGKLRTRQTTSTGPMCFRVGFDNRPPPASVPLVKTTIDFPQPLLRQAKAAAAARGQSLTEFVTGAVETQLGNVDLVWHELLNELPTVPKATVAEIYRRVAESDAIDLALREEPQP